MIGAGAILVQICSEYIYGGGSALRKMQTELAERVRWDRAEAEGEERRRQQQAHRQAHLAQQAAEAEAEAEETAKSATAAENNETARNDNPATPTGTARDGKISAIRLNSEHKSRRIQ